MLFHPKTIVNRKQVLIIGSNWQITTRHFKCCWSISLSNDMPLGGCQRQFSKGSHKNIYSDIICICTGMFSLLDNIEQQIWQRWSHTHVDVCQRHLSQLVAANDGQSETLVLSCIHTFLTYLFDVLRFFMIKLQTLLV